MKAFKLSGDESRIYFRNLERIPAEKELNEVLKELREAGCSVGEVKAIGLDDVYHCEINRMAFKLYFTGEETFIYCDNQEVNKELMEIFK